MTNIIVKKILDNDTKFTIFYSEWCPWSVKAVNLLKEKNVKFKGYIIDKICKDVKTLSKYFLEDSSINYDPNHLTRPIVFKNKKFVGGYTELVEYFSSK